MIMLQLTINFIQYTVYKANDMKEKLNVETQENISRTTYIAPGGAIL